MFRLVTFIKTGIILTIFCFIFLSIISQNTRYAIVKPENQTCVRQYKQECLDLFKKLRFQNESLKFKPPTAKIPDELLIKFTQNGQMPLKRYAYINEAFDSSNQFFKYMSPKVSAIEVKNWQDKVKKDSALGYTTFLFEKTLQKLVDFIANKSFLVVGSQQPWIEALALELFAVNVTTLDFAKKEYEQSNLKWHQHEEYLDYLLENQLHEQFSNAASYSHLEHIGLGRYGEPLSPDGDINTLKEIQCLLKPGGYLFLGLQTSKNMNESYIEFNYHRVYGEQRLNVLFNDDQWNVISAKREDHNMHSLFVLQKKLYKTC